MTTVYATTKLHRPVGRVARQSSYTGNWVQQTAKGGGDDSPAGLDSAGGGFALDSASVASDSTRKSGVITLVERKEQAISTLTPSWCW